MNETWIVVVEDRHADVEVLPFTSEVGALEEAHRQAEGNALEPGDVVKAELTQDMIRSGWCLLLEYSPEGDSVRVVRRELDRISAVA